MAPGFDIFTDEEVEHCYEEFYDDVHTEFLKYGEIVNFKVCKNGSFHLRGNLYVHYKSVDSAVLAYNANNGRFYAGKQVICEFVNVTRWKIAICGEFMKTRYKTCSHGTACNFIHCFRNPGGDYEWADSDKPPPRYWVKKMASLFGFLDESENEKHIEFEHWDKSGKSSKSMSKNVDRYRSRRSNSRSLDHDSRRSNNGENDYRWIRRSRREKVNEKQQSLDKEEYKKAKDDQRRKNRSNDADSDESVDKFGDRSKDRNGGRRSRRPRNQDNYWKTGIADRDDDKNTPNETNEGWSSGDRDKDGHQHKRRKSNERVSETFKTTNGSPSRSVVKVHDTCGISSDRNKEMHLAYGEKPKKHLDEVTNDSDDQLDQKSKLKTDYEIKKSSAGKSDSRYFESSSRDLNTEDGYSIDSLHSDVLSDESQEPSISDRHVERFEPLDFNKEYCNDEHINKEGRWDPKRRNDEFEKGRETTSAISWESGSPVCHHGNKVNKQSHRELSSNSYEHRRSRRKSSRHDGDNRDLKSEKTNSDDDYLPKSRRTKRHKRGGNHKEKSQTIN